MSPTGGAALKRGTSTAPEPRFRAPPPPARRLDSARQPLYLALARTLMHEIDKGRYAVGSALPTEDALARHHGVSRHTVRQALRELKDEGVVWARAGIGTIVRSRPEAPRFFSGIKTVWDLLQFVEATEMHVVKRREVVADAALAELLHCPAGQAWYEITILRKLPQEKVPLSYLQVYLRPEFVDAVGPEKIFTRPIYSMVEERFGVRIVEVRQEITAANLEAGMARALKAKEGLAAMRITRYYLDRDGAVIEVGVGYYPSGRYTQRSRFQAQSADGAGAGHG
ncbi:MAG: GntR family transcriptional regulator [Ramlibacter sp.]